MGTKIDFLPPGPYLSRLRSLLLSSCGLMPAALAAATQLRFLNLSDKSYMALTATDRRSLSSLPALKTLIIMRPDFLHPDRWDERVARLKATFSAQDRDGPLVLC